MARIKHTARKSAGGKAPRKQLATRLARTLPDQNDQKHSEDEADEETTSEDEPILPTTSRAAKQTVTVSDDDTVTEDDDTVTEDEDEDESIGSLRKRLGKPTFPLQTIGQIMRMQAKKVIAVLKAHATLPRYAFNSVPITNVEVESYLTRIRKLRVSASDKKLAGAKTEFVRMLEQLQRDLTGGFHDQKEKDHRKVLERLTTINAKATYEYARHQRAHSGERD